MASRPEHRLNLNYLGGGGAQPSSGASTGDTSPVDPSTGRSPFGNTPGMSNTGPSTRIGAGSPSLELSSRLYSKRAREIQQQEGLAMPSVWGPPASGGSTPLRETIPESPNQDGFPDLVPPANESPVSTLAAGGPRRARAGTVPSRFPGGNTLGGTLTPQSLPPKTSRPTPSSSPFRPATAFGTDNGGDGPGSAASQSALLSRLRAGSMPQRANLLGNMNSSPFGGNALFTTGWGTGRDRGNTLSSIRSSDAPDSPAQSNFSREGISDQDVKTLDYLGLAETPQQRHAYLAPGSAATMSSAQMINPLIANLQDLNRTNRYRSYSVNAKEKYAEDEDDEYAMGQYGGVPSGQLTPSAISAAAALAATNAQIRQHNLAVQAFASQATANRPRARTAGVLDSPLRNPTRSYLATPSRLDSSISAADLLGADLADLEALPDAIRSLRLANLTGQSLGESSDDHGLEGPTRALWLGNIPTSTTVSSLQAIFRKYGPIESTRVLVQKNCGFVNFESIESAIAAKSILNGTEIFPGAGPVRIGFAKAPSASGTGTPGGHAAFPSPSPDPFKSQERKDEGGSKTASTTGTNEQNAEAFQVPQLSEMREDILKMVREFGADEQDVNAITVSLQKAIDFDAYVPEIPTVPEPSHARVHDAPKLREIRKRIDNNAMTPEEIEEVAMGMLPEIAELAADYLGNTVVQKLFEYCSESTKEMMLQPIAPHLAEIGVHKNGTWAAQKIIDVAKTPAQFEAIVDNLRPYAPLLFLDQYGNYVLQCCLRFGAPWNNFVFETMLRQLWEISQGRFGARAMRACLESHHATKDQQRLLASAIALHSVKLATNANSALLLTWLLDTCNLPRRRTVLAPRIVPYLVQLCTHKVAYLTVLKIINQRNEPEARDTIIQALFHSPDQKILEEILSDQTCGATLIHKILTTPFWDENARAEVVQNVRNVLVRLKVSPSQGYKRLMDEVGLSSRSGPKAERETNGSPYEGIRRTNSQGRSGPAVERPGSGPYAGGAAGMYGASSNLDAGMGFDQFGAGAPGGQLFNPASLNAQQLQYQQALLNGSARNMPAYGFEGDFGGFGGGMRSPPMTQNSFPMMPGNDFGGAGQGMPPPPMMNANLMGNQFPAFGQPPYYPQQQQQQQGPGGGRRGRQR